MVLLFLLDAIASTALYVTIKCGVWIVYNTANGVYYLYKKIKPPRRPIDSGCNSNTLIESKCRSNDAVGNDASAVIDHDDDGIDNDNDVCVILSHEEYKKLKGE
jgi:hypothetical protein